MEEQSISETPTATQENILQGYSHGKRRWMFFIGVIFIASVLASFPVLGILKRPQVPLPIRKSSSTLTPDCASWKTYVNMTYGFSLQYPACLIQSGGDNGKMLNVAFVSNDNTEQLFLWVAQKKEDLNYGHGLLGFKQITKNIILVDGHQATRELWETDPYSEAMKDEKNIPIRSFFSILLKDKPFVLEFNELKEKGSFDMFDHILSSIKFQGQDSTPTCRPRPACLDATPRCMIKETFDMCPPVPKP